MQIALFGASGHLGGGILDEALQRGHEVVAIVRDPARLTLNNARLKFIIGDLANPGSYAPGLRGVDAVIAAISGRRDGNAENIAKFANALLELLPKIEIKRLVWVGGAGSLETAPGVRVVDDANFPAAWKPEALAQAEALAAFRASQADVDWTYISPAALIEDGPRSGNYRIGGEQLLVDAHGVSRITVADYAAAVLDRVEKHDKLRQRITVAY